MANFLPIISIFQEAFINSVLIGLAVTGITLLLSVPAGYAFSRYDFRLRTTIFVLIIFARMLPPIVIVLPYYELYGILGIRGTHLGLILAHLTLTVPLIVWVMSGFFSTVSPDLDRAARMDGSTRAQLFRYVIIPAAAPGIAVSALLAYLTSWNEYIFSLFLGQVDALYTLAPVVGRVPPVLAGVAVIYLIPPVIAAIFLQKYITRLRIVDPMALGGRAR